MAHFETSATWKGGQSVEVASAGKPAHSIMPPPEFGGEDGHWTPEDLLIGAVESCLLLTTLHMVKTMSINLVSYSSSASGELEKTAEGLRIQGINVNIQATVGSDEDVEKMNKAVETAEKFCPVSAAVSCPISAEANVSTQ
jgi:organic hydroperoxide reductase OsmC/OhrA